MTATADKTNEAPVGAGASLEQPSCKNERPPYRRTRKKSQHLSLIRPTAEERKKFTAHKMALLNKAVLDADVSDLQYRLLSYITSRYLWKAGAKAYPGYGPLVEEFG